MTGAIVITWGASIPGREAKGVEVFGRALEYTSELAKQGRIHSHKEYFAFTGNASDLSGIQVIEGDVAELQRVLVDDEFRSLTLKAGAIVQNFAVTLTQGGSDQSVGETVARYLAALGELGYTA